MKLTICLAKTMLIFYSLLAPVIIYASSYNLIKGVIMGQTPTVWIGPFSLFGFMLLPLLIVITYRKNKCVIQADKVTIGKSDYLSSDYSFFIHEKYLALADRPIVSLLRKTYYVFVIKRKGTNKIVLEEDIHVFQSDIRKMKLALLTNYNDTNMPI